MAKLTGKGAPTRKTIGGLGDIYTDTITWHQYECVFAYRDDADSDFDCQWKPLKNAEVEPEVTEPVMKKESKPKAPQEEPKPDVAEPETKDETPQEEPKPDIVEPETKDETPQEKPKRKDYTSYSKKK